MSKFESTIEKQDNEGCWNVLTSDDKYFSKYNYYEEFVNKKVQEVLEFYEKK